jgi:hypothetical protein
MRPMVESPVPHIMPVPRSQGTHMETQGNAPGLLHFAVGWKTGTKLGRLRNDRFVARHLGTVGAHLSRKLLTGVRERRAGSHAEHNR